MTIEAAIDVAQSVLPYLYVALSIFITMHVLRNKSDPRASLLWIALVWFSPLLGAILYFLFGINRIRRRARRLGVFDESLAIEHDNNNVAGPADKYWSGFRHLGNRITGFEQVDGNHIEILEGVDPVHNAFIDAINSARRRILLTTFIFKKDYAGRRVIKALTAAHQRGVDVYISLDGYGNGFLASGAYRTLKRRGIKVHRFLHSYWPWRMPYLNLRNHRKLLIVDERVAFTGSLNIGRVENLETHFAVRGPVLSHLVSAFEEDWKMSSRQPIADLPDKGDFNVQGKITARGIKSGPAYVQARTKTLLSGALGVATRSVRIVTPYFVPDKAMLSDLELASLRGVNVEIILPRRSNYFLVDWASRRQLKSLIRAGCNVYLRPDAFDHSKLMVIDDRWSLIGSSNWDARSLRLNFEFDLECEDHAFAQSINRLIDGKRDASQLLTWAAYQNRNRFVVLRDSAARLLSPYM